MRNIKRSATNRTKLTLFMSAAVAIGLAAGGAHAQAADPAGATANAGAGAGAVAEVVVTARKRDETLQSVPLSISAVTAVTLQQANISSAQDLYGRVPSVYFSNSGGAGPTSDFTYLVIRGVGMNGGQEPAAGVFIDGMYVPQVGFDLNFIDADRVEILRGPQGTLFGRNTEAGAINIVTHRPDETVTGDFEAYGGSYDTYGGRGSFSGPVASNLFASASVGYNSTAGYLYDSTTNKDGAWNNQASARGMLRWLPNDQWDIRLEADGSYRRELSMGFGVPYDCHCYTTENDAVAPSSKENYGAQLNADWKINKFLSATSITGVRDAHTNISFDYDGFPTPNVPQTFNGVAGTEFLGPYVASGFTQQSIISQRVVSQELRLNGTFSTVNTLLGLYYFDQEDHQIRNFNGGQDIETDPSLSFFSPGAIIREDYTQSRDGYAAFGQASWRPIPKFELTAGGRYSYEDVSIGGARERDIFAIENNSPNYFSRTGNKAFDNFSWLGSAAYHFTPSTQLYGTISRGWKAGGFNRYPTNSEDVIPYNSELSTNYEIGLKSGWFQNRLIANLTAFYIDISGQQLVTITYDSAGVPLSTIVNAGKSRSQGFEGEITARPDNYLRLNLTASYTDARYISFLNCAAPGDCVNEAGRRFEWTPPVEASASLDYLRPINESTSVDLFAEYRYIAAYIMPDQSFIGALGAEENVPGYSRVNLNASVIHKPWKFTLRVENLLNSYNYDQFNYSPFRTELPENALVTPLAPRTVLAKIAYSF